MDPRYLYGFWAIIAGIGIRIVMHFVDKNRIKNEVESRLGRVVSIRWNPFGRGWLFEKGERHYQVTYVERSGRTISIGCKTSLFTGVYWAEGPRVAEAGPRIMSPHLCAKCGYSLNLEWRACPNCGEATKFA